MTKDKALRMALEALEQVTKELLAVRDELAERGSRPTTNVFHQRLWDSSFNAYTDHAIPAAQSLRQAIEQAEKQEPTYYLSHDGHLMTPSRAKFLGFPSDCMTALYTTPQPQREWVGLTDKEIVYELGADNEIDIAWAHEIEAKLKEKNT